MCFPILDDRPPVNKHTNVSLSSSEPGEAEKNRLANTTEDEHPENRGHSLRYSGPLSRQLGTPKVPAAGVGSGYHGGLEQYCGAPQDELWA